MKTKKFKVSVNTVLDGAKAIEKEARKILSDTLFDALKLFGLDKVVKDALNEVEKGIDKLLDKANLDLPLKIKGLDSIDAKFDKFLSDLQTLEINIDLETPSMALKAFDLLAFEDSLNTCKAKS